MRDVGDAREGVVADVEHAQIDLIVSAREAIGARTLCSRPPSSLTPL